MTIDQRVQELHDRITELESRCKEVVRMIEEGRDERKEFRSRIIRLEQRWQGIKERWLTLD